MQVSRLERRALEPLRGLLPADGVCRGASRGEPRNLRLADVRRRGNGAGGIGPVLLEVRLRFQEEITNAEEVLIRSRTVDYRGKIGRVEQVMLRADGKVACTAELVIALFDLKRRKLIPPTPEWLQAVGLDAIQDTSWKEYDDRDPHRHSGRLSERVA
jgi:acyl-CoA thioesterase FadM